jgi:hypothetical protein
MGFRLLRSYYTLGAVLTLVYPQKASDRAFVPPKPLQDLPPFPTKKEPAASPAPAPSSE